MRGGGLRAYTLLYLLFLYAPILLLPIFAFNSGTIIAFPLQGVTTEWFAQMWGNATLRRALVNSLTIAVTAMADPRGLLSMSSICAWIMLATIGILPPPIRVGVT